MEIADITKELTNKVIDPNKLYKISQIVSPIILLPKLPSCPCNAP